MEHVPKPILMARIARIRVLETVTEGHFQTYRVVDPADNSTLLAHYGDLSLLELANRLGEDVLERGDSGGFAYMLTPDRPDLWNLNVPIADPPMPKPAASQPQPASTTGPGEFTRMFQVPSFAADQRSSPEPATPVSQPPTKAPEPEVAAIPEPIPAPAADFSFTGMFSAMSKISAEAPAQAAAKTAPAPEPPKVQHPTPEKQVAPPRAEAPPPAVEEHKDSEFTSFFRPVSKGPAEKPATPPSPPPAPAVPSPAPTPTAPASGANDFTRPASGGSEFTRMFAAPQRPPSEQQPQRARPVDQSEFTRMFSAAGPAPIPPQTRPSPATPETDLTPPPAPVQPPQPPIRHSQGPGEFTQMFQQSRPQSAGESLPLPPKPASHDDSDFTRFFNNPLPAGREPDWKAIDKQPAPAPAPKREGDFTRMFGRASTPAAGTPIASPADTANAPRSAAPGAAPSSGAGGGAATDLFAKPKAPAQTGGGSGSPQSDDYAKLFSPPKVEAPKPPAVPAAIPVQAAAKAPPIVLVIVIIVAVLVLAGCAVYYFVFRK